MNKFPTPSARSDLAGGLKSERLAWAKQKRAEFKNPSLFILMLVKFYSSGPTTASTSFRISPDFTKAFIVVWSG